MTILVILQYCDYFTESHCYRFTSKIEILYSAKNHLDTLVAGGRYGHRILQNWFPR